MSDSNVTIPTIFPAPEAKTPKPPKAAAPKAVKPAAKPEKAGTGDNPTKPATKPAKANAAPDKPGKAAESTKPAKPKPVEAAPTKSGKHGLERESDVPWNEKKVAVWKALAKVGALSSTAAATAQELAENGGVTSENIRHYCYHMKAGGLVGVATLEGKRGYCFYLTAKGSKLDIKKIEAELKA